MSKSCLEFCLNPCRISLLELTSCVIHNPYQHIIPCHRQLPLKTPFTLKDKCIHNPWINGSIQMSMAWQTILVLKYIHTICIYGNMWFTKHLLNNKMELVYPLLNISLPSYKMFWFIPLVLWSI